MPKHIIDFEHPTWRGARIEKKVLMKQLMGINGH